MTPFGMIFCSIVLPVIVTVVLPKFFITRSYLGVFVTVLFVFVGAVFSNVRENPIVWALFLTAIIPLLAFAYVKLQLRSGYRFKKNGFIDCRSNT